MATALDPILALFKALPPSTNVKVAEKHKDLVYRPKLKRTYDKNPFCNALMISGRSLTKDSKLNVVFRDLPDGVGASYCFETNTLTLPRINTVSLTQEEADKLRALSYHERLHHALTDHKDWLGMIEGFMDEFKKLKKAGKKDEAAQVFIEGHLLRDFVNFLEDARIEMNKYYRLPGDLDVLYYYRTIICKRDHFKQWELMQVENPLGALMMAIKFGMPEYLTFNFLPHMKPYWDIATNILFDGRFHAACEVKREGTAVMITLAKEILKAWEEQNEKDHAFDMKYDPKDLEKSDGPKSGSATGIPLDEDGEEGIPDEDDEFGTPEDDPLHHIDGAGLAARYKRDQEKEDGKWKADPDPEKSPSSPDVDKSKGPMTTAFIGKDWTPPDFGYIPYDVDDRTIVAGEFPEAYLELKSKISHKIQRTKNVLVQLLMAEKQTQLLTNQRRGRINPRQLHKLVMASPGAERIFTRKKMGRELNSAVQLVIDLSGSMGSVDPEAGVSRAELAAQIATLFAEAFAVLKVPFEIIGYNTDCRSRDITNKMEKQGYTRVIDVVNRWVFKEFHEEFYQVRNRLGACCISMNRWSECPSEDYRKTSGAVGGCNVDHEVVQWGAARLWARKETKKLQIVLADGQPSGYNGSYGNDTLGKLLRSVNQKIVASGIEQFSFGMQTDCVKKYYARSKAVFKLDDLTEETLRLIATSMGYTPE